MKVGLLGAGMIVHDLLSFANDVKGMELEAICATPAEETVIQKLAEEHGIKKATLISMRCWEILLLTQSM